ncbi:DNA polymerase III alpha subunit [Mucinivorans hirudinis]|uniref:DNA polymerase III subunit alpha n=1 Tax=Mucinivorans hirudinis TaxID=1433126 RepID=A0A060R9C8_9BACT|nr:DNA polymerase III alpha subunit [Mucinivorans hirudinis]
MFTHLHTHTQYSILDGAAAIKKLLARAGELGQRALAITDHGNMFGVKEFHAAANKAGIKPILGCEVYVATGSRLDKGGKEDRGGDHLILLAKNPTGYHNLVRLVSYAWTEGFYYNPRIDKDLLAKYHEGLICCSACLGGEIPQFLLKNDRRGAEEAVQWFKNLFGEDYYLELQLHPSGNSYIDERVYHNQKRINGEIVEIAAKYGVKCVATNDVHYVKADDAASHDRLICLSTGKDLDDPNRMRYTTQEYLKSEEEMLALFAEYPEAVSNTQEIVDKIESYSLSHKPYMPSFPLPEGFEIDFERLRSSLVVFLKEKTELIELVNAAQSIENLPYCAELELARQQLYLEHISRVGFAKRYGDNPPVANVERLDFELKTIEWMGFPGYFLIVWDFIRAGREMGVSVGPGRGSAAGSVVAYCLGITNIDPIKYDLLFERFLNPERISMPDVDIDFDEDGREKVLKYVVDKYGQKRVAHIITFGTMAAKSSIKDVARIHKLPLSESDRLSKMVPESPGITLEKAYKEVPELAAEKESENDLIRDTLSFAERLEGSVRQTGVHACGVIIGSDDLENFIPMSTAKDAELFVVQYEGSQVEDVGLLKMDFLGLKTLSIIKDAVENVKLSKGIDIDIDSVSLEDKKTFELYSAGDTTGLFQFESPGMKKHLRNLKPNRFEDLIAMNALYRPGPMEYIDSFIRRKHGHEKIEYDLPDMEEYLADTYGITVYQEQVMLLSQKLAGFTKGQADTLRKAMGKKMRDVLDKMKATFIEGATAKGHPADVCGKIWKDWEAFAQYAFNKSHSTCYAYVSYQTAYLKAHYPAEFMAALLSRNLSDIKKISTFMDECKRMGAAVKGPDVNHSYLKFSVDENGFIRFGLGGIKGVGENASLAIIAERRANGRFKDIYDFVERVPLQVVNKKNLECLATSGALDSLVSFHRSLFFATDPKGGNYIEQILRYGNLVQTEKNSAQNSLFGDMFGNEVSVQRPLPTEGQEWGKLEMLEKERELVGIYLSSHPLDDYRLVIEKYCTNPLSDLSDIKALNGRKIRVAGMVTSVKHLSTKAGKPYGRMVVEDFSGSHEFTFFSRDWENFRPFCFEQNALLINARVGEHPFRPGELELAVESMELLSKVIDRINNIEVDISVNEISDEFIDNIHGFALANSGNIMLNFNIYDAEGGVNVRLKSRSMGVELNGATTNFFEEYGLQFRIS